MIKDKVEKTSYKVGRAKQIYKKEKIMRFNAEA